jgi:hypothetical protein
LNHVLRRVTTAQMEANMPKPILLALLCGLAGAALIFTYLPSPEPDQPIFSVGVELVDDMQQDMRLRAESKRTLLAIYQRETIVADLLEERISLEDARREFHQLNDDSPTCWISLRATYRNDSDEQCLDFQLRKYVQNRRPTPERQATWDRIMARFEELPAPASDSP